MSSGAVDPRRARLIRSIPNLITLLRLACCLPLVILFLSKRYWTLFVLYLLMEVFDQLDGKLAKACGLATTTGMFFDGVADSLTHLTCFACLLSIGIVPLWMYLVILFREVELLFHRLLGGLQGTLFGGHWPGKGKALVQAVVLAVLFYALATGREPPILTARGWLWLAVLASAGSGIFYATRYRRVWRLAFLEHYEPEDATRAAQDSDSGR